MSYTAKDVQSLRQTTGAGMMDCKKALEENGGEIEAAKQWLREKGLAASAKRDDRENAQGVVAIIVEATRASIVKLKSETDFVASSDGFKAAAAALAQSILEKGEAGLADHSTKIDDLKITLKEKIEVGETIRFEAASGNVLDFYNHIQGGRGVNGVIVEMSGATQEVAHDVAVHIAFARPRFLRREDVQQMLSKKSVQHLKSLLVTKESLNRQLPKLLKVASMVSLKTFVFLNSLMPRTTNSALLSSSVLLRSCDSHR